MTLRVPFFVGSIAIVFFLAAFAWLFAFDDEEISPKGGQTSPNLDGREAKPTTPVRESGHQKEDTTDNKKTTERLPDPPSHQVVKPFLLTKLANGSCSVNLSGGESRVESAGMVAQGENQDETGGGKAACGIYGMVNDAKGRVQSAVVLAGPSVDAAFGHLVARNGGTSDSRGWFDIQVECGQGVNVMAMHRRRGWSKARSISIEQGRVRVDLNLEPPTRIEGMVTRGGLPERAGLRLVSKSHQFSLDTESDDSGRYRFDGVPPGSYELVCGISTGTSGNVPHYERIAVEVPSGEVLVRNFDLGNGPLVVANVRVPKIDGFAPLLQVAILDKDLRMSSDDLAAYLNSPEGRRSRQVVVGSLWREGL